MAWIWERVDWPSFRYDIAMLAAPLTRVAHAIGRLHGRISGLQVADREQAAVSALAADVQKSSAIEGEKLDLGAVRSSLGRRLGVDVGGIGKKDRHIDGVVEMTLDATRNADAPLTAARLKAWQAALFPTGRSGLVPIRVAQFRGAKGDPMRVVSGPHGRQRVHFEAPPARRLTAEVRAFLRWFQTDDRDHPLVRAGLAHLWFVTLHPFDDGNGRVARAIGDLVLSRHDDSAFRYYSVSAQILAERNDYYDVLERTQRGKLDVTPWLSWFLACLERAVRRSDVELDRVLAKALFWQRVARVPLTDRQVKALNKVLDTFDRPVTNRQWAALTKTSGDTALRDLRMLVDAGVLERTGSGRSAAYWLRGVPRTEA